MAEQQPQPPKQQQQPQQPQQPQQSEPSATSLPVATLAWVQSLRRQVLSMTPVKRIDWRGNGEHQYTGQWEWQEAFVNEVVLHAHTLRYPPSLQYQKHILNQFITLSERTTSDIHDQLYERYMELLNAPPPLPDALCFKTHYLTADMSKFVVLKEREAIISSGTTGLVTWTAAFVLVDWIKEHPDLFEGQRVVELGAGAGYAGLCCAKLTRAKHVILTDCHGSVLSLLSDNVLLNTADAAEADPTVSVEDVDWTTFHEEQAQTLAPSLIIASDVVYDLRIIDPLVATLKHLLHVATDKTGGGNGAGVAYLAATVRNKDTLDTFLSALVQAHLSCTCVHSVGSDSGNFLPVDSASSHVNIYAISLSRGL